MHTSKRHFNLLIVMLDDTCLTSNYIPSDKSNSSGFQLGLNFLQSSKTAHKISCHQELQLTPECLFLVLSTDHVAPALKSWLLHVFLHVACSMITD